MVGNSLIDSLRKIRLEFTSPFLLANPFFRLSKPNHENLIKYKRYDAQSAHFRIIYNLLRFPLFAFLQGAFNILLSFFTYREWVLKQNFRGESFDYLGISQVTSSNQEFKEDPLLGEIPLKVAVGQTLCMFYLNGTRIPRGVAQKSLSTEQFQNSIVNSKTLSPIETIEVFFENLSACGAIFRLLLQRNKWTSEERLLLSEGLLYQLKRPTFANLFLMRRLNEILDSVKIETIFFTLEGHAHEAALITLIKNQYPQIQIRAIQHAPIVPSQIGYFDNLNMLRSTDAILCSGEVTYRLTIEYLKSQNAACKDVRVIGSSKNHNKEILDRNSFRETVGKVLLLPEGTENSAVEFLQLLRHLSLNSPNLNFVLRLHPATRQSPKVARHLGEILPKNASISEASLMGDFEASVCCIYRGSAAAIEGLAFGVIPIHYNSNLQFDLDPIVNERLNHPRCTNYEQLEMFIKDLTRASALHAPNSVDFVDFFQDYYAPLKIEALS